MLRGGEGVSSFLLVVFFDPGPVFVPVFDPVLFMAALCCNNMFSIKFNVRTYKQERVGKEKKSENFSSERQCVTQKQKIISTLCSNVGRQILLSGSHKKIKKKWSVQIVKR